MCAQAAHASIAFLTRRLRLRHVEEEYWPGKTQPVSFYAARLTDAEQAWIEGRFTKICVSVNSEEELLEIERRAKEAGVSSQLITDAGLTEFGGVATRTCLAIGPDWTERIDPITSHLPLL